MLRRLIVAVFAFAAACHEEGELELGPIAWGEPCEFNRGLNDPFVVEGGCDHGLQCDTSDDRPQGSSRGICVESCNDDLDCAPSTGTDWVCAHKDMCVVPCTQEADCPADLAEPLTCASERCVIRR